MKSKLIMCNKVEAKAVQVALCNDGRETRLPHRSDLLLGVPYVIA